MYCIFFLHPLISCDQTTCALRYMHMHVIVFSAGTIFLASCVDDNLEYWRLAQNVLAYARST